MQFGRIGKYHSHAKLHQYQVSSFEFRVSRFEFEGEATIEFNGVCLNSKPETRNLRLDALRGASRYYLKASSMRVFYTPRYYAEIGASHIFPIRKFELVRDRLLAERTLLPEELVEPEPATPKEVCLVHTEDYVSRLCNGTLTSKETRRLGLPWSESLVRRSFYAVGGTICASRHALEVGFSSNLAGGTHHAFADRGEGFCVFND